jgi:hypothetical protein
MAALRYIRRLIKAVESVSECLSAKDSEDPTDDH